MTTIDKNKAVLKALHAADEMVKTLPVNRQSVRLKSLITAALRPSKGGAQ